MRLSNDELKSKYYAEWNDDKNDIGRVLYGDDPLIKWDKERHKEWRGLTGTLSNIEAVDAYIWSQNGDYYIYHTLLGQIYISTSGKVLGGDIKIKYRGSFYGICLNLMYGLSGLSIMRIHGNTVVGWCNKDGIGSPSNSRRTKEIAEEEILKVFSKDLSDYGESVGSFMRECVKLYDEDNTNCIMSKTFELRR